MICEQNITMHVNKTVPCNACASQHATPASGCIPPACSIYAILAVEFYSSYGKGGSITTWSELDWGVNTTLTSQDVRLVTSRGMSHGEEYFGTFSRALYTLFQVSP